MIAKLKGRESVVLKNSLIDERDRLSSSWDMPFPVFMKSAPASAQPSAGPLTRFADNPVLEPIPEHPWESKYVLNAASIRLGRKVHMLYRAYGEDKVSRIGLAISEDGFTFSERLEKPIFEPQSESETMGCEDPRVTLFEGHICMAYTAYNGEITQIGLASIGVKDFLDYRWEAWQRHGLFFAGYRNKDGAMFPELFSGKFGILHRLEPDIWITFSPDLRYPWSRREDRILARPGVSGAWDAKKIGAGAQPIKTGYGWLLITHGVDHDNVYRLGVMLLDLLDPRRVIYRSPNFILEPATSWEMGGDDSSWVPNVVFTCGAVPREDGKEILDAQDELLVYYGGADSVMNLATAKVGELIPEDIRNTVSSRYNRSLNGRA